MNDNNLEFLDILTILSFVLQIQNQGNIVGIRDVQNEVDRAIGEIHAHLEEQDRKIDYIIGAIRNEDNQTPLRDD